MAKFDGVIQSGLKALSLLEQHETSLTKRLPAGHGEYLRDRLTQLGAAIPSQKAIRQQAKHSSVAQLESMTALRQLLTAIRDAVKADSDATTQDKKEYGLGQRLDPKNTKSLLGAAQTVLKSARAKPDRAQALGILPEDITQLEASYQAASAADSEEDARRAAAPLSTKARNALVAEVTNAVRKIGGAGLLAFAMNDGVRAEFEALLDGPRRRKGGPEGKAVPA